MRPLALREFHRFESAGQPFLYLVPSAAVFQLDEPAQAVLDVLQKSPLDDDALEFELTPRFPPTVVREASRDLLDARAIGYEQHSEPEGPKQSPRQLAEPKQLPPMPFPLNTIVLNVTNQCNLACTYCYEYGEDKIVD